MSCLNNMSDKPFIVLQTQVCSHLGSNQRTHHQKCAMRYLEGDSASAE